MDNDQAKMFGEIQRDLGSIIKGQDDLKSFVQAVSTNQKATQKDLEEHIKDDQAHGSKTRRRLWDNWAVWVNVAIALGMLYVTYHQGDHNDQKARAASVAGPQF